LKLTIDNHLGNNEFSICLGNENKGFWLFG